MPGIQTHRDLKVWQEGMALTTAVYRATGRFPDHERFGLVSQLRRAVVAFPSNIAEGWGRGSRSDYVRFLHIARGSLHEVDTQIRIAQSLGYLTDSECAPLHGQIETCGRLLTGLIRSLTD